ncbi:DUF397 domain-containing protein [Streptomyces sp. NPDC001401]
MEVAGNEPMKMMVRDTKARSRGAIAVQPAIWVAFVEFAKEG